MCYLTSNAKVLVYFPFVGPFARESRYPTWGGSLVGFVVTVAVVVAYTDGTFTWHWIVRWGRGFVLNFCHS